MPVQLNEFENKLLNRIIPTQTLSDSKGTQIALRNFIADDRENIMAERNLSELEFKALQTQSVKNIFTFLKEKEFIGEREGGVNFLTDKGKHLRKQGSLEKYEEWRKQVRAENRVIIHTIETKGYLDQDQINRNRRAIMIQRIKRFVLYPIMFIILLAFLVAGAHHYKLDDNLPFVKNLFHDQPAPEKSSKDKDDDDDNAKEAPKAKKHKG